MTPSQVATTGFLLHPSSALHDTGPGHPEHPGRLRALADSVGREIAALGGRVVVDVPVEVDLSELRLVHTADHLAAIEAASQRARAEARLVALDPDTVVSAASLEAALGAVGAAWAAAGAVARGDRRNAFVATRPPGHHASSGRAMGFCLFNTVALTARWLQERGLAERVLVVDWDVHHGNGTQDVFWEDPSVHLLSLHQAPHWPGTGRPSEIGAGAGEGATHNVEVAAGADWTTYGPSFERALDEAFEASRPDFVLVSAGYDALAADPLGGLCLGPADFHRMTEMVLQRSSKGGESRLVAMLEGGYDPPGTGSAVAMTIRALAGVVPVDSTLPADEG